MRSLKRLLFLVLWIPTVFSIVVSMVAYALIIWSFKGVNETGLVFDIGNKAIDNFYKIAE